MIDFIYTIVLIIIFNIAYRAGGIECVILTATPLIVGYLSIVCTIIKKLEKKMDKDSK